MLTVGGSWDSNTPGWGDDTMYAGSSWRNPTSDHGDREKPEVVAPGQSITTIQLDNNLATENGTSLAAPQVTGVAALLRQRNSDLAGWPTAMRAIIMASAANNVDGPRGIPTGQDLKDGAGAIDAALADSIAKTRWTSLRVPCTVSCWWGIDIDNTNLPVGGPPLDTLFRTSRGERIRVAISWWAYAECPDYYHCGYDSLDTNLNLKVTDPDGAQVLGGWSASFDNNYELLEFVAPKTGQYKIRVYKASSTVDDASNNLGIAWTAVPDVNLPVTLRNQPWPEGQTSTSILAQNLTPRSNTVTLNFYQTNGTQRASQKTATLGAEQSTTFDQRQTSGDPGMDPFQGASALGAEGAIGAVVQMVRTGGSGGVNSSSTWIRVATSGAQAS